MAHQIAAERPARPAPFRRRRYVINKRYQWSSALLTALALLLMLAFVNLLWYAATLKSVAPFIESTPGSGDALRARLGGVHLFGLLASCVIVLGGVLVSILETHRTAGAMHKLGLCLDQVAEGRYDVELILRRNDHLREAMPSFNRMAGALVERTRDQAEALDRLAARARESSDEGTRRQLAAELAALAEQTRARIER